MMLKSKLKSTINLLEKMKNPKTSGKAIAQFNKEMKKVWPTIYKNEK